MKKLPRSTNTLAKKIYEIELKECGIEHIADVSRNVRLGECWAYINEIPIRREYDNYDREKIFVCFNKGCTASATNIADLFPATVTEQTRAVQEGRLFGYHRFDVSCPDYTPERCYIFCPQFDDQEVR